MDIDIKNHFGSQVYKCSLSDFMDKQPELVAAIEDLQKEEPGLKRSNKKGWQSNDKLHKSTLPIFKWLTQQILDIGDQCIRHAEGPHLNDRVFVAAQWANVNPAGAWNAPHHHVPCEWVGVCYVKTPPKSNKPKPSFDADDGDLVFIDGFPLGSQYRSQRPATLAYSPAIGDLFIFPGYLLHMVAPHTEEDARISVAFNFRLEQNIKIKPD